MAGYNKSYKTENLFGEPYPELIDFFSKYEPKGKLLDLGCGQGRDSISLVKIGYKVTGIDNSKVGINQMNLISEKEGFNIIGLVGDIYTFDNYKDFDIVLIDSIFHFQKRDKKRETDLIVKIAKQINKYGVICFCIQDTGKKLKTLKEIIDNLNLDFDILNDTSLIYNYEDKKSGHKSETKYSMYIVKKK